MASRPHGYQRYIHDGCRCDVCKDANRLQQEARRDIDPLRKIIRDQAREGLRTGKNAAQIAAALCRVDEKTRADWLRLFVQHEVDLVVLRDESNDLPGHRAEKSPAPRKSGRWQVVSELSKDPLAWTFTAPRGRTLTLAECRVEDLEEIAEQYADDAHEAERWHKRFLRLLNEMDAVDAERVGELPDDVVREVFES